MFSKYKKLIPLSVQQLIDCPESEHNYGCAGGTPTNAYSSIVDAGGIETEADYPYRGKV